MYEGCSHQTLAAEPRRPGLGPASGGEAMALAAAARMRRAGMLEAQER
jgi:hypothetical protein